MSESGFPGCKDFQDVIYQLPITNYQLPITNYQLTILSESGYPGFEDFQDVIFQFWFILSNYLFVKDNLIIEFFDNVWYFL